MEKPVRTNKQEDIVWKDETRLIPVPYCPVCKQELRESGKDYRPYYCECGDWYWVDDSESYEIHK